MLTSFTIVVAKHSSHTRNSVITLHVIVLLILNSYSILVVAGVEGLDLIFEPFVLFFELLLSSNEFRWRIDGSVSGIWGIDQTNMTVNVFRVSDTMIHLAFAEDGHRQLVWVIVFQTFFDPVEIKTTDIDVVLRHGLNHLSTELSSNTRSSHRLRSMNYFASFQS